MKKSLRTIHLSLTLVITILFSVVSSNVAFANSNTQETKNSNEYTVKLDYNDESYKIDDKKLTEIEKKFTVSRDNVKTNKTNIEMKIKKITEVNSLLDRTR